MSTHPTPGPGDEETWGPCTGHPLDPRTDEWDLEDEYDDEDGCEET